MKKKIEYLEVTHHGMKGILITEQSHKNIDFGINNKDSFLASNGFRLISFAYPDDVIVDRDACYVQGDYGELDNSIIFFDDDKRRDKFIEAVKEYNDFEF